jgi:hypothetical protein
VNELKLPEQLKGPWHHALILTYGLDVPFFENALWGQFGSHCRNKIILADGQRYLEACANYARSGLVRYLNQRYVAEGICAPRAAHAKLILLTNSEQGLLLVGSGNLKWQGYASGGELFTRYEYSTDAPEMLNAFLTVRELIEGLMARRYISAPAEKRIRHLLEETPWLFQSPAQKWQPVRHNLTRSFLDQLQLVVGDEPVEELWVLSPFYDRELVALERLLTTLNPHQTILLMQPGYTSVDPAVLQGVLDRLGSRCQVHSFSKGDDSPYVHAKLYLLKLPDRAICLQGSPNLSQVAMLLTVPQGNIELANLLTGPRHAFDDLLDALDIQPVEQVGALALSYQSVEVSTDQPSDGWRLTGGEWYEDRLVLSFQGALPELEGASLVIAGRAFSLDVRKRDPQGFELRLSPEAMSLLGRPVPIAIRWGEEDDAQASNPIFVCNRAALADELQISEGETLDRVGDLDLDDEEFERLLGELNAALMIDRRSVWQLAGRTPPTTGDEDDEALRLDYVDVDYEMLRQHPRIQQYVSRGTGGRAYARSRLQIILSAITDHFRGLIDVPPSAQFVEGTIADLEKSEAETEEEREQEEEEKQRHRRTQAQRVRRILKSFIRRYLRGIRSPDFQELAGFEVIAQNYVIFTHILWRLLAKDWVEPEFVVGSLLQTWTFFWGDGSQAGYFRELDGEQRAQVLQFVQGDQHSDAVLVAALYCSARLTRIERWEEQRFALRDFWREMLRHPPFEVTADMLEEAWHIVAHLIPYEPPPPTAIVEELARLAEFESHSSFLRALEERYHLPRGACSFERQSVWRVPLQRSDNIQCLVIGAENALPDKDIAVTMLREWMRFEELGYYRIHAPANDRLLYYEGLEQKGLYWAKDRGEMALGSITPSSTDWDAALSQTQALAAQVDAQLVFPLAREKTEIEQPRRIQAHGRLDRR